MSATQVQPAPMLVAGTRPLARFADITGLALRLAPAPVGLACWANSMASLRVDSIGLYGLLAAVNAWFFVGLGLLILGFAAELSRPRRQLWILVLYLVSVVVVIHGTAPLLFHTPEYWWVYRHLGVARSLGVNGRVTDSNEIYQQWPTFFSALAGTYSLAGVSPVKLATWAPVFFELADCLVLLAIFRSMTRDSRVPIFAVLLFECLVTWVGQDYLSPQAFAYLIWLGLMLVVLRWLVDSEPRRRGSGRLGRLRGRLLRGFEYRPAGAGLSTPAAAVIGVMVLFFVIVSSHQLTPYITLAGLGGLALLGVLRPRWLVPALALIAVAFLLPRVHVTSPYGGLFSGFDIFSNATVRVTISEPAALFSEHIATGVSVVTWLLALVLIARSWRSLGRVAVPAVLAFTPFVIILAQNYGGEAGFRVFLFSAPWCAYLIASAIAEIRWSSVRTAAMALVPAVILLASMQGLYGPLAVDAITPDELTGSEWFYAHAPAGSSLILAAQNFPVEETAAYESYEIVSMPSDPQLHVGGDWLPEGNLTEVDAWTAAQRGREKFLAVSRSMAAYSAYYGAPTEYQRLVRELPSSPDWTLSYKNPDVTIYKFVG